MLCLSIRCSRYSRCSRHHLHEVRRQHLHEAFRQHLHDGRHKTSNCFMGSICSCFGSLLGNSCTDFDTTLYTTLSKECIFFSYTSSSQDGISSGFSVTLGTPC